MIVVAQEKSPATAMPGPLLQLVVYQIFPAQLKGMLLPKLQLAYREENGHCKSNFASLKLSGYIYVNPAAVCINLAASADL